MLPSAPSAERTRVLGPSAVSEPSASSSGRRRHLAPLDGLRGIAILLVVVLHGTDALSGLRPVSETVLQVTNVGFTGVDLFFVLSGFLITGILLDAKGAPGYFRIFYARRVLRIFPLYYAYLALIFLLLPHLPVSLPARYAELRNHQVWYWAYLSNVLNAINAGWGIDGRVTGHFWSLAVEEQFYLVWPAIVFALSRARLRDACIVLIASAPFLRLAMRLADVNPVAVYVLTPCRVDALAVGALIAVMLRSAEGKELIRRLTLPVMVVSIAGLTMMGTWRHGFGQFDGVVGTIGYSVWAAFYGSVLAAVLTVPPILTGLPKLLSARWLRFFGKYSYAMYVFHQPLAGLLQRSFPRLLVENRVGSPVAGSLFVATLLGVSTLAALLSWWLLESRFIALKDRFQYSVRPLRPAPPLEGAPSSATAPT